MKTRKDSNSKLSKYEIQIPLSGTVLRVERKTTMTKLIRVLLGLVVALTFLGNILFIMETTKMNRDEEKASSDFGDHRESIPSRLDGANRVATKASSTTTSRYFAYTYQSISLFYSHTQKIWE